MGFNGNTNDAINESFTDDSLGQTSYRTVTEIRNSSGVPIDPATEDKQDTIITSLLGGQLVPERFDEVSISYTGENITGVVYKYNSDTVATLTLAYTDDKITSVIRS